MNVEIKNMIKLLQLHYVNETIVYEVVSKNFYIHFIKDGSDFLKDLKTGEIKDGSAGELIFLDKRSKPKLSQIKAETKPKLINTQAEIALEVNENKPNIDVKIDKNKEISIIIPNCWNILGYSYAKHSFQTDDKNYKKILRYYENVIDDMNARTKEKYTIRNIIKDKYEKGAKFLLKGDIEKAKNTLKKIKDSEKKQLITIQTNENIVRKQKKEEKSKKILIFIIISLLVLSLILFANIRIKKNKNKKSLLKKTEQVQKSFYTNKDTLQYLIKDFEKEKNFKFTEYRTDLIYTSLQDTFKVEKAKEKINFYYNDLKK